jgi:hypothetical protein
MTAQPCEEPDEPELIHLGGQEAAVVPIAAYRRLKAIERHAPAGAVADAEAEEAEIAAVLAEYDSEAAAGAHKAIWHEDFMRELFGPASQ